VDRHWYSDRRYSVDRHWYSFHRGQALVFPATVDRHWYSLVFRQALVFHLWAFVVSGYAYFNVTLKTRPTPR